MRQVCYWRFGPERQTAAHRAHPSASKLYQMSSCHFKLCVIKQQWWWRFTSHHCSKSDSRLRPEEQHLRDVWRFLEDHFSHSATFICCTIYPQWCVCVVVILRAWGHDAYLMSYIHTMWQNGAICINCSTARGPFKTNHRKCVTVKVFHVEHRQRQWQRLASCGKN